MAGCLLQPDSSEFGYVDLRAKVQKLVIMK